MHKAFRASCVRHWPSRLLRQVCRLERVVCMTYDDGPGVELTREVAKVLASYDAKATFFALGGRAVHATELLDEIVLAGHEVACHTSEHLNAWKRPRDAVVDLCHGYNQLSRWLPVDGMFRPPYGKMNPGTVGEIRRRRAPVGWWTIDSGDTHDVLPTLGSAAEALLRDGGGVVLLHDFDRVSQRQERASFVLDTTRMVLDSARREGIRPITMGALYRGCASSEQVNE